MKHLKLIVSAAILVVLYFPGLALPNSLNYNFVIVLVLAGATGLLYYLKTKAGIDNEWVHFGVSEAFFYSQSDGRYYKNTFSGWREIDEDEIED